MTEYDSQVGRSMPSEPDLTLAQAESGEDDVESALADLAQVVSDVDELEDVLAQIAGFALDAIPGADGTGVTLVRSSAGASAVLAWSVTADFVREIDRLQYEVCGEGPCLTAMQTERPLVSGSLGSDSRWPLFGGRVARLSVHSALALPLLVRGAVVGAINVYAREPDAFTEHAIVVGERFAGPAAVTVHNTSQLHAARARAAHLQTALQSRPVIDQAIGIIRSRSGGSEREAFERLRQASQTENVKLFIVAQRLVDEAVRRAHARHG
jgi:GAF domain-containing protein